MTLYCRFYIDTTMKVTAVALIVLMGLAAVAMAIAKPTESDAKALETGEFVHRFKEYGFLQFHISIAKKI